MKRGEYGDEHVGCARGRAGRLLSCVANLILRVQCTPVSAHEPLEHSTVSVDARYANAVCYLKCAVLASVSDSTHASVNKMLPNPRVLTTVVRGVR